jgi:hypothetical protein
MENTLVSAMGLRAQHLASEVGETPGVTKEAAGLGPVGNGDAVMRLVLGGEQATEVFRHCFAVRDDRAQELDGFSMILAPESRPRRLTGRGTACGSPATKPPGCLFGAGVVEVSPGRLFAEPGT